MTRADLRAQARELEDASDQDVDQLLGFLEARAADLVARRTVGGPLIGEAIARIVGNARLYGARALTGGTDAARSRAADSEVVLLDACLDLAGVFREHEDFQARWTR